MCLKKTKKSVCIAHASQYQWRDEDALKRLQTNLQMAAKSVSAADLEAVNLTPLASYPKQIHTARVFVHV